LGAAPAVVVAHSLGCATALRLALDAPEKLAGLVLVAPATHPYPGPTGWHVRLAAAPLLGPLVSWFAAPIAGPLLAGGALKKAFAPAPVPRGHGARVGLALAFRPSDFRASARDVAAAKEEFAGQYFRYHEIEIPTVIVTSDQDGVASPLVHARQLARSLPRAELIATPNAGHMPHHLRPEAVAAAVRRLFKMA
jgi:pimeloyl-ACP methyl ester carboxylesterase